MPGSGSVARRTVGVLTTNAVTIVLMAVTQVFVTRGLSAEGRGYFDAAFGFTTLSVALVAFGWPNAAIHQIRSQRANPAHIVRIALVGTAAISLATVAVMVTLRGPIAEHLLAGAPAALVLPVALAVGAALALQVLSAISRGMDWFDRFNTARIIDTTVVLVMVMAIVTAAGYGVVGAMTAVAIGHAVGAGYLVFTVVRRIGFRLRPSIATVRASVRYGLLAYAQSVSGLVHERVDVLLLSVLGVQAAEIGRYGVAVVAITLIRSVPEAIGVSAFPTFADDDRARSVDLAARLCRVSALLSLALGMLAVATGPVLFPLVFGSEYRDSVELLAILVPASAGLAVYRILGRWLLAVSDHRAGIISQGTSVVINVVLNVVLIPRWGAAGAATATLVSYTIAGVQITRAFCRATGMRWFDVLVARPSDASALRRILPSRVAKD